jgi:hypothetical protein
MGYQLKMLTISYTLRHFTDRRQDHPRVHAYEDGFSTEEFYTSDIAILYATYIRELGNREPGKFDGAMIFEKDGKRIIRVVCGNDGRGSVDVVGKDFDYAI